MLFQVMFRFVLPYDLFYMMIHLGRIIAADLVEYNPERDIDNITAEVASKLLKEIAGKMLISNNVVDR